jgi:hypothetical protein
MKEHSMDEFIHIRSEQFPILPGEEEEIINEGMYGKAMARYLESKLKERGYLVGEGLAEDWGWFVPVKAQDFIDGICIYARPEQEKLREFVCTTGILGNRKWSWRKFRFVETAEWKQALWNDLKAIFEAHDAVELVGITEDMPF